MPSGAPPVPDAQLFQDTSGAPSPPPMVGAAAQHLMSNPMMTAAAMHYGQELASQGQAVVDRNIGRFVAMSHLKTYFAVDTNYVLKKLSILLFPFVHKDWTVHYQQTEPIAPRLEINAPDLYIPVMGFVTYVLVSGLVLGTQQRFSPEHLGITASSLLAWLLVEVLLIWLCLYLLAVVSQLKWLDIFAYCGYKYVSMIVSVGVSLVGGRQAYYAALAYSAITIAYFLVQSLRLSIQPHVTEGASKLRNYFLLLIALLQPLMMLWLTYTLISYQPQLTPS